MSPSALISDLPSIADILENAGAPSYSASKAAFSCHVVGLAGPLAEEGVALGKARFGFVDTKMAKGDVRPLMISVDRAVQHLMRSIATRPRLDSRPRLASLLAHLVSGLGSPKRLW